MADSATAGTRRPRADAQRNVDSVLDAATRAFAERGVDAPVREIARRAGVGTATLYRHFPSRADLIQAVFRREVDACADAAEQLGEMHAPMDALEQWLYRFADFLATKRGLAPALHSDDASYGGLPRYFLDSLGPALQRLLDAAVRAKALHGSVGAEDLLLAVSRLCSPGPTDDSPLRLARLFVPVLLRGLAPDAAATDPNRVARTSPSPARAASE